MDNIEAGVGANLGEAAEGRNQIKASSQAKKGLPIEPVFCPADVSEQFDTVDWELRTASIKGDDGEAGQAGCADKPCFSFIADKTANKHVHSEAEHTQR